MNLKTLRYDSDNPPEDGSALGFNAATGRAVATEGGSGGVTPAALAKRYVLRFENAKKHHVRMGHYFKTDNLGVKQALGSSFFVEAIAAFDGDGYLISDGDGGAHSILGGPSGSMLGNIWDIDANVLRSFGSHYTIASGQWGVWALAGIFNSAAKTGTIYNYLDGVITGVDSYTGIWGSPGSGNVGGPLFIGGSDHLNMQGWLAFMRIWMDYNPRSSGPLKAYTPDQYPFHEVYPVKACNGWWDFTQPGSTIFDQSAGYESIVGEGRRPHHGVLYSSGRDIDRGYFGNGTLGHPDLPTWVEDDTCPFWKPKAEFVLPSWTVPAPVTVPANAVVWDSFGRADQDLFWRETPTLGQTEGGSAGPLTWQYGTPSAWGSSSTKLFGIKQGRAVILSGGPCVAWVSHPDIAGKEVGVLRTPIITGECGIAHSVVDKDNFVSAYWLEAGGYRKIRLGFWENGSYTLVSEISTSGSPAGLGTWQRMSLRRTADLFEVLIDGAVVGSATIAKYAGATGAGITTGDIGAYVTSAARNGEFWVKGS
jgi:hypothetical protein